MDRYGVEIDAIVDINPSKQGKFIPITGIEVISPDQFMDRYHEGTEIVVMNRNYLDEIQSMIGNGFTYLLPDEFDQ